jgi:hypothetical protein
MTMQEVNTMVREMVESKVNTAFESIKGFGRCEEFYNMVAKESPEVAEAFKSIVLLTMVLHPDFTEQQVLEDFYNRMYNK